MGMSDRVVRIRATKRVLVIAFTKASRCSELAVSRRCH